MDGVLIDSEPVYIRETYDFLKQYGVAVQYQELYRLVGTSSDYFWQTLTAKWPEPINRSELETLYTKENQTLDYSTILFPHVGNILGKLKAQGLKIGLASSSSMDNILTVLKDCRLGQYFDVIVSGEAFEESKPHPEIYLSALEQLGIEASQCIAVEDSTVGITAAKSAGLYVVAKEERRFGFDQGEANCIIRDLLELLDVIENWI